MPIEVSLMTPTPTVDGVSGKLRPKHLAVLAYLAVHRTVAVEEVRATFWPTSSSTSACSNTISLIRKHLGANESNEPHLGGQGQGRLILGSGVGSDWTRFEQLLAERSTCTAISDRIYVLVAALSQVAGTPAADPEGSADNWLWLEQAGPSGHPLSDAIQDAAIDLVGLAEAAGLDDVERWARAKAADAYPSYGPVTLAATAA
jgi:hypothetical protein